MSFNFRPAVKHLIAQNQSLRASLVYQGGTTNSDYARGVATGYAVCDAYLPWQGWPIGAMTELITDKIGCGEISLLLPAMARLSQQRRSILCIGVPHALFAPALRQVGVDVSRVWQINPSPLLRQYKDHLWSAEQALKTGVPGMVILWSAARSNSTTETLRRLHMACSGRDTLLIHFRDPSCIAQPSPAWLRVGFTVTNTHLRLQVLKCRGQALTRPLISLDRAIVQPHLFSHLIAASELQMAVTAGQIKQAAVLPTHSVHSPHLVQ
jgi:protein ImuA